MAWLEGMRETLVKKERSIDEFLAIKETLRRRIESEEGLEIRLRDACPVCGSKVYVIIWSNEQDVLVACGSGCIATPVRLMNWSDFIEAIEVV